LGDSIVFVTPCSLRFWIFGKGTVQPVYGPILLGTILRNAGFKVRVIQQNLLDRPIQPSDLDADWLGLCLFTPSAHAGYEICRMYRAARPDGRIIAGGIHPTFCPEDVLPHVDHIVKGEAENVIVDLLKYGSSEKIIESEPVVDLDNLPMPDFSLLTGGGVIRDFPIVTSRGCPHKCDFCQGRAFSGSLYRKKSPERVIEEMKLAPANAKIRINDDNFGSDKERCDKIIEILAGMGFDKEWSCMLRANRAGDPDFVRTLKAAGCHTVGIGIETVNPKSHKEVHKGQTVGDAYEAVNTLLKNDIQADGYFIVGFDSDDVSDMHGIVDFCQREQVTTWTIMVLTPYPGTPLAQSLEAEGRIFERDWRYYDSTRVVFHPRKMSARKLQEEYINVNRRLAGRASRIADWAGCAADVIRNPRKARRIQNYTRRRSEWKRLISGSFKRWMRDNKDYICGLPD